MSNLSQIKAAAVKAGGKIFTGPNHAVAIKKAQKSGQKINMKDRWKEGNFLLKSGKVIDRNQAQKMFGINHSEAVPQLRKMMKGR